MSWLERELKELPFNWQNIPMRWEIVGVQKNRIFLKEVEDGNPSDGIISTRVH